MVSHWSLSDNKSPQVFRTLLNNAVDWMDSTRPLISKSFRSFINPLVTVPRAPITIGNTVAFMFHSFFQFSRKVLILLLSCFPPWQLVFHWSLRNNKFLDRSRTFLSILFDLSTLTSTLSDFLFPHPSLLLLLLLFVVVVVVVVVVVFLESFSHQR